MLFIISGHNLIKYLFWMCWWAECDKLHKQRIIKKNSFYENFFFQMHSATKQQQQQH